MLTMSRISPFCKRKHPLSIPSKWWFDRCKTRHRTNSFIPANLPLLSPSFSNFIVSRRCAVCLKRRERERERVADEIDKRNEQMERDRYDLRREKIKREEKKEKERREKRRWNGNEMEMNRRKNDARNKSGINDNRVIDISYRCAKFNESRIKLLRWFIEGSSDNWSIRWDLVEEKDDKDHTSDRRRT